MEYKDKIKAIRKKLFMSQQAFARELNVAFETVNRWETGKYEPSYAAQKSLHELCQKNGIKIE